MLIRKWMEGFSSGSEGGEANEALFFAGLHCRHHADCAIGIGERRGFFGPRRRLGWRRLGWWRLGRRLGRLRLLLSSLGSATSAAVLLLRRLEQRRLEQRPLEQRRLEQRWLGWWWLGWWRRLGWLVARGSKRLAAVEISFFDRHRSMNSLTSPNKWEPHGAAPSPDASMLIGEPLQVIIAIVSRMWAHWTFCELTLRVSKIVRAQTIFALI